METIKNVDLIVIELWIKKMTRFVFLNKICNMCRPKISETPNNSTSQFRGIFIL